MKQRKQGNEIAVRQMQNNQTWYVAQVPGDGGVDWGYTSDRTQAMPLNRYFMRRFVADMRRVGAIAYRSYI